MFANGLGDLGSIPGRVLPKTLKMVLDISLLNIQQYKVHIKGKVEQFRERSGVSVVDIEKGAFWLPSTTIANFTLLFITLRLSPVKVCFLQGSYIKPILCNIPASLVWEWINTRFHANRVKLVVAPGNSNFVHSKSNPDIFFRPLRVGDLFGMLFKFSSNIYTEEETS